MKWDDDDRPVRKERSHWRDEAMSLRHKEWGFNCPAVDLDFVMIEYDSCRAVALVEYKHQFAAPQKPDAPSFKAMVDLGDRAQVYVFAVRYAADFSWFLVVPLNYLAKDKLSARRRMTELEYVTFLYLLRGRDVPPKLTGKLSNSSNEAA